MRICPACGHTNLPSFPTCSKCGASLANVPLGPGQDDYAKLAQQRAAAQKRQKAIIGIVGLALVVIIGGKMFQDRAKKADAQAKLDLADKWGEMDRRETGAFWACVMASEVNVDSLNTGAQILQRVESAYATQPKTFSEHLVTECVPKIERARQAFGAFNDAPPELAGPIKTYASTLPKLQAGIEEYAEKIKGRGQTKDLDSLIQDYGNQWHSNTKPTPETIAFDKFLSCAIPDLAKLKDPQAILERLADECYKKDAVKFMDRVRSQCGPMLQTVDAHATPAKTYAANQKRFYEEEARQLRAWEDCGRKSRKGKKSNDLESFLAASGEYMEARSGVVKAAKAVADAVR